MTLKVESPYSGELVCAVPFDDAASIERKLARAALAQGIWRARPVAERVRVVATALEYFRTHAAEVARDITLQMGKPIAQSRNELAGLFERAEAMLALAEEALAPDVLPDKPGFLRRIEHVPLGVVFDLAAWNYPLLIPINVVVPALLSGNAVLLKHSALTPLCGVHFERAFAALEPQGLFANLVVTHEGAARIVADERVAHVAFTGSVAGGRAVQRAAAGRFIEVGLELGGKDPAYVAADADLDLAVPNIVDGACYNAGQSCCAIERVYVHATVHAEFLERAQALLAEYRTGDPLDEGTTMGPLAQRKAIPFLEDQVQDAVRRGARLLAGGTGTDGRFFAPTLLDGCPNDSEVMQAESFGPLLPVLAVGSDEEALAHMNDSRFGLTASIWTEDEERAERMAAGLETGTVFMNRCDYLDPALPWTGVKDSGKGVTLSRYGFQHLTRRKSIHLRVSRKA
ncbi:MAG: aldehyde dehydrogenase family protein [Planctomycetota bacterium]|nr:MAG: aldehyde dehydrogenase family protein [Planctomycetota bacterium]